MAVKTKPVQKVIKLQIKGGQANPAPPVGSALGPAGLNIMEFCKQFNAETKDKAGVVIPVEIYVYADKSFTFKLKTPPAVVLIKKAINIESGSSEPNKNKVGEISWESCRSIAKQKMEDLNAYDLEAGARIIAGTARSIGVRVVN